MWQPIDSPSVCIIRKHTLMVELWTLFFPIGCHCLCHCHCASIAFRKNTTQISEHQHDCLIPRLPVYRLLALQLNLHVTWRSCCHVDTSNGGQEEDKSAPTSPPKVSFKTQAGGCKQSQLKYPRGESKTWGMIPENEFAPPVSWIRATLAEVLWNKQICAECLH